MLSKVNITECDLKVNCNCFLCQLPYFKTNFYCRVCPFIKPVGKNCVVEKKEDQCCPTISCPPGKFVGQNSDAGWICIKIVG